jgi:hypothetical protein
LAECDKLLTYEESNADYFLQQDTKPKLLKVIQKEIIINQSKNLVDMETGCDKMFNEGKIEELDLMYKVFNKEPETLNYVIKKMSPYI